MKKFAVAFVFVLSLVFLCSLAYGAQATVTATAYGYSITGGTGETTVTNSRINIKAISLTAQTANDTVGFRDGTTVSGPRWYIKATGASGNNTGFVSFYPWGAMFDGFSVQLSAASDVVFIYT